MESAYINGVSYYLPHGVLTNEDINRTHPEWTVDKISNKTGIYYRHIADEDEFVSDMAIDAANRLFQTRPDLRESIDFVLLCTQSPDYMLPTTACIVQSKLNLSKTCGALDFNLGCSGYIYGLGLAKGLIVSGQAKNILLLTSESYSKFIHPDDKSNKTIFGDGASATLVTSSPNKQYFTAKIHDFTYGTDGNGSDYLIVKNSGKRAAKETATDVRSDDGEFLYNDDFLFMDGKEIFNFTAFQIPPLINSILEKNHLSLEEIDTYIFHQANAYMLDFIRKRCKIPEEKFYVYLKEVGNTVSSTIPIALKEYMSESASKSRSKILLAGFGVGLSMGGVVLEVV